MLLPINKIELILDLSRIVLRIMLLWVCYFLLTLFHTDIALFPLFSGYDVHHNDLDKGSVQLLLCAMLIFFSVPMISLILLVYTATTKPTVATSFYWAQVVYKTHFYISLIYTFLNICHFISECFVFQNAGIAQLILTVLLILVGLKINQECSDLLLVANEIEKEDDYEQQQSSNISLLRMG